MRFDSFLRIFARCFVVALFFGVVSVVVLTAYGYRYDRQENRLEPTGIIRVNGAYRELQIVLDGTLLAQNLPASISGVKEGFHRLEISKMGYASWRRDVRVQSGMITNVPTLILVPDDVQTASKRVISVKDFFKTPVQLVSASPEALIFFDGTRYSYVDIPKAKKYPLSFPKELEGVVLDVTDRAGYAFKKNALVGLSINLETRKISITREDPFSYSREGLQFIRFAPGFQEFLYEKGGEIASIVLNLSQSKKFFTRFAEPVKNLSWYRDTNHFVVQVGDRLQFCDETFGNCFLIRAMMDQDSFSVTQDGIYSYIASTGEVLFLPLSSGENTFLSYIFSEQVSL